jgi:phosphatidylinositol alpha-1,6-mannosyltransferase
MVTASLAVRLRRRLPGVVLVTITHGQDVTMPVGLYQQFVPKVFAALDAVFPVSRATGAACVERGCDPVRVHVVPNGVDPDRFSPVPEGKRHERLRAAFPEGAGHLTDKALILCSVGRQVQRKGFHWFIDHVMPDVPDDVQYWLAGEGPMGEVIQETIHRHGLEQRVQLLGRVTEEQLEALYQGADLFIMPNIMVPGDMEGFGVVMLEAGLCGLPALGARLEGIQDVITDTENGHLVASGNAGAFAELIIHYHRDRAALADLGRKARRYTLDTFTWPAVARRYVELFRQSL